MPEDPFLEQPLLETPLVILDTETTGLYAGLGDRIVELAAVRYEGWQEVARISTLLDPGRPMNPSASAVNNIFDADLVDQPPFATIAPELRDLTRDAVLVAHNATFDAAFVGLELFLAEQPDKESRQPVLATPWICTLRLARRHFHFGRNNLEHVARKLGVRTGRSHRALSDTYTTAGIFKRMARVLRRQNMTTVGDLLYAQGEAIYAPPPPNVPLPSIIAAAAETQTALNVLYMGDAPDMNLTLVPLYAVRHRGVGQLIAQVEGMDAPLALQLDLIMSAEPAG